ncbi:MAG: radical SAM protein [Acutalibacteraceae bacterium]|nr:radical SAM protein [Acutalibacteraceae bacterium]
MSIRNLIAQYKENKNGISHCTFNPEGPGVVRIHLVPPKFRLFGDRTYIVILNGYYMLPLGYSWALLLSKFMKEVNAFAGKPITESDEERIFKNTVKKTKSVYPSMSKEDIEEDLEFILRVLFAVARGDDPEIEIEKLSLRQYSKNMTAPHRMDLLVSAMTDADGKWQCNQKCTFCYAAGQCKSQTKELGTDDWKKVIEVLYKANVPMVTFTGGEPTMREDIATLVAYAEKMVTRLNTNGINLTPALVDKLKKAGLDSVQVTLYSYNEEVHNALVGSEHFKDTVNGIKNAVDAGLDVSVNTPLCKKNKDYIKTLEFIKSLGVSFVTVSGLICTGMAEINHEEYDLSEDALFGIVKEAKMFCTLNEMEMDFTSPGLISKEKLEAIGVNVPMCGAALSNMAIAPDGTVVPCQSWLNSDADLGNILTDKFSDIWKNKKCLELRGMTDEEALVCPFRMKSGVNEK